MASHQGLVEFGSLSTIDYDFSGLFSSDSLTALEESLNASSSSDLTVRDSHSPLGSYGSGIESGETFVFPLVPSAQDVLDDSRPAIGWLGPIHMAVNKGHDKILRLLIEKNQDCNEKDSDGTTPLILAVIGGHEDVTETLLRHGARVAEVDRQRRSALHWAVVYRREVVLKILLQHCVGNNATTINGYDNSGRTPLHTAIDMEFVTGVEILLAHGADVSCKARRM
jgi:hypothetical protein